MIKNGFRLALMATAIVSAGCAANVRKDNGGSVKVNTESAKALVLNISGSTESVSAPEWESFKRVWNDACGQEAASIGAAFSIQTGETKWTGQPGTIVAVDILDYRYITAAMRYAVGGMSGNAYIDARVNFLDLGSGLSLGTHAYNTSSVYWQSVFSAVTVKQVRAICHEIIVELAH